MIKLEGMAITSVFYILSGNMSSEQLLANANILVLVNLAVIVSREY